MVAKQKTGHWLRKTNWGSEILKQAQSDVKCCSPKVIPNLIRDLGDQLENPICPSTGLRKTNWGSEILKQVQNDVKCCSPKVIPNLIRDLGEPVGKPN
ncbi:MAG: hypothetical protein COY19_09550, partial [Candidatus Marinimicrobia bacterium CG_4_10_14_0_2_um_filter_48_9]